MASVVALPDPALLELLSIEVDETVKLITVFAVTISPEARCPLCQQARWFVQVAGSFARTEHVSGRYLQSGLLPAPVSMHVGCSDKQKPSANWPLPLVGR
jgi:hypothetical protein